MTAKSAGYATVTCDRTLPFPNDSRAPARSAHKGPLPPANSFWTFPRSRSPRPSPAGKWELDNVASSRPLGRPATGFRCCASFSPFPNRLESALTTKIRFISQPSSGFATFSPRRRKRARDRAAPPSPRKGIGKRQFHPHPAMPPSPPGEGMGEGEPSAPSGGYVGVAHPTVFSVRDVSAWVEALV
ncbi:MAG: hypothetical protein JWM16_2296 [Verrucomicrobiales bacterium]|nr:hypothetical protein [Verrucomicrobiales bacterium]